MPPRRKNWNGIAPPPTGLRRWALRVCSCGPAALSEIYEGTPRAFVIGVCWPSKQFLRVAKPGSALHHRRLGSVAGRCECARVVRPCSSEINECTPRTFVIGVSWPSKHLRVAKPGSALHHRRLGSVAGSCECARVVRLRSPKSMRARRELLLLVFLGLLSTSFA